MTETERDTLFWLLSGIVCFISLISFLVIPIQETEWELLFGATSFLSFLVWVIYLRAV